jgi:predicted metal-dependent hydrolase
MTRDKIRASVQTWADKMGVAVHEIHLRAMRTKWASLSTDGRLTLNDELLGLRDNLCDYVIVHELVHLKVRNHGKLFKSLMHAYLPGWEEMERELSTMLFRHEKIYTLLH